MVQTQEKNIVNAWIESDWDTYISTIELPEHDKHRSYYYKDRMRIEDLPIGADHARYHAITSLAVGLFCIIKNVSLNGLSHCTYRRTGSLEYQPDLSFYTQHRAIITLRCLSVTDLEKEAQPDLVVEISSTTLDDDLSVKQLTYEDLGVSEYWIVDVQNTLVYAFEIIVGGASPSEYRGSRRIDTSLVLSELSIATITEALTRSKESDQAQVGQWLMSQFQG